jgi:hypothetical protein
MFSEFDYLIVVDFEATCEKNKYTNYPHEIIEFPAVLIHVHRYLSSSESHFILKCLFYLQELSHAILTVGLRVIDFQTSLFKG